MVVEDISVLENKVIEHKKAPAVMVEEDVMVDE